MANRGKKQFRFLINWLGPFIGLILVVSIFASIPEIQDRFLRLANVKSVATQSVIVALGALGMTLVIISGGIDLSAASNIAFSRWSSRNSNSLYMYKLQEHNFLFS